MAAVLAVSIVCTVFRYPTGGMNTMAGITVGFVGILVLAQVCMPFDKKRLAIWVLMAAGMAANILFLGELYSLVPLNGFQTLTLAVIMGASYPFLLLVLKTVPAAAGFWERRREKRAGSL